MISAEEARKITKENTMFERMKSMERRIRESKVRYVICSDLSLSEYQELIDLGYEVQFEKKYINLEPVTFCKIVW